MISPDNLSKIEQILDPYEYAIIDHNGKIYASKIDVSGLGSELSSVANISHYLISNMNDTFTSGEITFSKSNMFFISIKDVHFFFKLKDKTKKDEIKSVIKSIEPFVNT